MVRWIWAVVLVVTVGAGSVRAAEPSFKVLCFYSTDVEKAHVKFAMMAIDFYTKMASEKGFGFEATTDWSRMNLGEMSKYQLVMWLDNSPRDPDERTAFQAYMEKGGAWIGFHFAAYNDRNTHWPWFVDFLGGGVFYTNNWPPQGAKLIVDGGDHAVTAGLPATYDSPANEFYLWMPSPRANKDVKVLVTLDPANYPLGKKDLLTMGDVPVVWTNTKYHMVYINMGHGDKIFDSDVQKKLFENAVMWLGSGK